MPTLTFLFDFWEYRLDYFLLYMCHYNVVFYFNYYKGYIKTLDWLLLWSLIPVLEDKKGAAPNWEEAVY